jgi:hypothetical protein
VKRVDSFLNVLTTIMVTGTCQKWGTRNSRPRKIKGSKATEAPQDIPLDSPRERMLRFWRDSPNQGQKETKDDQILLFYMAKRLNLWTLCHLAQDWLR